MLVQNNLPVIIIVLILVGIRGLDAAVGRIPERSRIAKAVQAVDVSLSGCLQHGIKCAL